MKVTPGKNRLVTEFKELKAGDTFEYNGIIFIRVVTIQTCNQLFINAIKLKNGEGLDIDEGAKVIKVDGEFAFYYEEN